MTFRLTLTSCTTLDSRTAESVDDLFCFWFAVDKEVMGRRGTVLSVSVLKSIDACQVWVWTPSKAPFISISKTIYPYCRVLVRLRPCACIFNRSLIFSLSLLLLLFIVGHLVVFIVSSIVVHTLTWRMITVRCQYSWTWWHMLTG